MNRSPVLDPQSQCRGKLGFKSRAAASRMIRHRAKGITDVHLLDVYHCCHCGLWHFGHRPGSGCLYFGAADLKPWNVRPSRREQIEAEREKELAGIEECSEF